MTDTTVTADTLREMLAGEAAPNRAAMTHTAVRRDLLRQIITLALEALALRTPSEGAAGRHLWVMEEIAATLLTGDRAAATKLRDAIDFFATTATPPDEGLGVKVKPLADMDYMIVHDAAQAAYEAATPSDYRYSATALRKAVDAGLAAVAALQVRS